MQPFVIDCETIGIPNAADYLEPVTAPSNYKKPEAIAAYIAEETPKQLERASLDIDLAQIICLGIQTPDGNTLVYRGDKVTEVEMLTWLWEMWNAHPWDERIFVTFNGTSYDVPLLLRRSLYLGIKAPIIQCDRFKHPQIVDLMTSLNYGDIKKTHGLQFYLQRFGYPGGGQDVSGKDIAALHAAGDWDAIAEHCRADVDGTAWLARRINQMPQVSLRAAVAAQGAF